MTQTIIHHQNGYEAVVAELRRVADALETVPAGFGPSYVSLSIQAGKNGQAASIAAVDAVALAVLGKKGDPRPIAGGKLHHHADSGWTPVYVAVYQQVPSPADSEVERLRAKVAELEAANARLDEQATGDPVGLTYSRVDDDPQVIRPHSPRLPLGTGAVVDGGELVPELSVPVHFLEPGADGEDDDQMACGVRFADAVQVSAFSGNPEQVTCTDCRKSAIECDYIPSFGEAGYPGCPGCGKTVVAHADGCTEDAS